jgi:hypothetical protein
MKTDPIGVLWEKLAKEKEEFLKYEEDGQLFPLINLFAALAEEGNKKKLVKECQDFLVHLLACAQIYEDTSNVKKRDQTQEDDNKAALTNKDRQEDSQLTAMMLLTSSQTTSSIQYTSPTLAGSKVAPYIAIWPKQPPQNKTSGQSTYPKTPKKVSPTQESKGKS